MSESTVVVPCEETTSGNDDEDGLYHLVCCNDEIALCGTNVKDHVYAPFDEGADLKCAVCEDLIDAPCCPGCPYE